jgi:hypothetical protein
MVLKAYFDDSGTHENSEVILIAGLVAPADVWDQIEEAWLAILAKEGVERFHRVECENGRGEFELWSRARRDALYHDLRSTLDGVLLRSSQVIYRRDWNEIVEAKFPKVARVHGTPYRMVLSECIQKTILWAEENRSEGEKVALLFDLRPQNSPHEAVLGNLYAENPRWKERIAGFSCVPGDDHPMLQAADLYAHDLYQNHKTRLQNPAAFKLGAHMAAMKAQIPAQRSGHLNRNWLLKYCADLNSDLLRAGQ